MAPDPQQLDGPALLDQLLALLRRDGLMDLIGGLNEADAPDQTTSWMGAGPNQPVAADQVKDALGRSRSESIAAALDTTPDAVAAGLARILPTVVDRLTPDGRYPDRDALASTDLSDVDLDALLS